MRYLLLVVGITLVMAGTRTQVAGIVLAIVGAVALAAYGVECQKQGSQPLTRLKPRTYNFLGALHYTEDTVLIAVSWHVDYGHYEYRLARLPRSIFRGRADQYSTLVVYRRDGALKYEPQA